MAAQPNPERFVVARDVEGRVTVEDRDQGRFIEHEMDWTEKYAQRVAGLLNARHGRASALHWISASEMAPWISLGGREVL